MGMLLEDIMLLLILGSGVFLIGIPFFKLIKAVLPKKENPLEDAQEGLEKARLELEAARLNQEIEKLSKEREHIYEHMYEETLQSEEENKTNRRIK